MTPVPISRDYCVVQMLEWVEWPPKLERSLDILEWKVGGISRIFQEELGITD